MLLPFLRSFLTGVELALAIGGAVKVHCFMAARCNAEGLSALIQLLSSLAPAVLQVKVVW